MHTTEALAREALILTFLRGYTSLASSIGKNTIEAYLLATDRYSISALTKALDRYRHDEVPGHDRKWAPNAAELSAQARMFDDIERRETEPAPPKLVSYPMGGEPPAGYVAMGPIEVSFDGARIDMRDMTPRERQYVMEHKRRPPTDIKRIGVQPRLQRMG